MDTSLIDRFAFVPGMEAPFPIQRAEGAYLYTPDGQAILDAAGGAIVANIGHGRSEVVEAAARAMQETSYVVPVFATPSRVALVERLQDRWLPEGLTRTFLTSGGSESVEAAIKLARQYQVSRGEPGRWKIIGRDLSYHGATIATLAAGGHDKRRAAFKPYLYDWPKAPASFCFHCPLNKTYPSCEMACASALEDLFEREGPETIAAFIAEPIVGSAGAAVSPPDEYWPLVADICQRHGVLLIADEVMTGFGRTGKHFGVDHWNVRPDILVAGKGLAGGYAPIGGLYTTEDIVGSLAASGDDLMFYTFGAHPSACAAADKVLEILERESLVARAAEMGEKLKKRLSVLLEAHPNVAEIRGRGLMLGIEFVRDRETKENFPAETGFGLKVFEAAFAEGVFVYPSGSGSVRDSVMLGPPFVIGDKEIEMITTVLERAIGIAVKQVEG